MANPFLVIGGVVVSIATAAIGVMQVPGWIDSANDSAVHEDLSQVAISQEAAYTAASTYATGDDILAQLESGEIDDLSGVPQSSGVEMQRSSGVKLNVVSYDNDNEWAAVGVSKSGHAFLRTSESSEILPYTDDEGDKLKVSSENPDFTFTQELSNGDVINVSASLNGDDIDIDPVTVTEAP